jgi:hypothetical protein
MDWRRETTCSTKSKNFREPLICEINYWICYHSFIIHTKNHARILLTLVQAIVIKAYFLDFKRLTF